MAYDISTVEADLEGILHGTTINQITNFFGLLNRAGRKLILDIDPQETIRVVPFTNPIYNQVYDYALPPDIKGTKFIDIRPQVNRTIRDIWPQQYNQAFDVSKLTSVQNMATVNFNTGIKTIRINAPFLPTPIILNQAEGISSNGTWAVGGDATDLVQNNLNFVGASSSLQFNLSGVGTQGNLINTTSQLQNIEFQLNQSTLFLYTYLPTGTAFTSVELQWGSSATDYYSQTTSVTQQNTVFQNGWNLLAFPWLGATVVGAPDPSSITFLNVIWNYNGSPQTGVLLNNITSNLGSILELEYYSKYLFRDAVTGAFQETVTSDTNLINLDTDSYNLFLNLVAYYAAQQVQGIDSTYNDGPFFLKEYTEGLARYKGMYKSQVQKPQSVYYKQPRPGYNQYNSGWWGI